MHTIAWQESPKKSLLSLRVSCQALGLLNSFKILTSILNRMQSLWWSEKTLVFMRVGHASLMLFCVNVTLLMLTEELAVEGVL